MKLKKLLKENFWNQVSKLNGWEAPPKEKRWSKQWNANSNKTGLTQFERRTGGKDYGVQPGVPTIDNKIDEASVSSNPFRAWSDHGDNIQKINLDSHWAMKAIPHKKKEIKAIQKHVRDLYKLIEIIKGQAIDL